MTDPDRHYGCRINDQIHWHGMRALLIQNELLQIVVLVDKGAEIIQFLYKPRDIDFLWRAPNRLRDPTHFVPAGGDPASPFFDHWSGGWFEVLPNGGPFSEVRGAPLGFYAETINLPWEYRIAEDAPERIKVALWVRTYRTPFLLQKTLTLESGCPALFIEERLTNEGRETLPFMWGHHPVVGAPFLTADCRISAPPSTVEVLHAEDGPDHRMGLHQTAAWPVIQDRNGQPLDLRQMPPAADRVMDNCYLSEFSQGWIAVANPHLGVGFGLSWDPAVFRYIWLWQALGGGIGYPWYGRTYNMGIEPWTSFPCGGLSEALERGTHLEIEAGASLDAWLTAVALTDCNDVAAIDRSGTVTQQE